jgi:phosphate transport system permease protein
MKVISRCILNNVFTAMTWVAVFTIVTLLLMILGPILSRGTSAIVFKETVEFRKMELALHNRGSETRIAAEVAQTTQIRQGIYDTVEKFKCGVDAESLTRQARTIYRDFGEQLRYKELPSQQYTEIRSLSKDIRDKLGTAFASQDKTEIAACIDFVMQYANDERFKGTAAEAFFKMAADFKTAVGKIDLAKQRQYVQAAQELEGLVTQLLGPQPDKPLPASAMNQFGATRWDLAEKLMDNILLREQWVSQKAGQPLVKIRTERAKEFAGTEIEPLLGYMQNNLEKMLKPQWRFYWQYFIDDSTPGHYFGGVGPEILGTLLLTLLSMLFVIPLGIISAAYLTECTTDNLVVKIIRMCINSLAGVPSIIFGLFGLAFFVLFLMPLLGFASKPCIFTASLTLSILTLPVMIRASEEAIKTVPVTYKEASLALGASKLKTFISVTLPVALPGILTGVILSLSRVAGETAPILFTGAVALGPVPSSVLDTTRTLSYGSYDMAVGDRLAAMVPHNQYGMVATLVILVLCLNTAAIILRSKLFKKLHGH